MKKLEGPEADYVKTSLRLPPGLRDEVKRTAALSNKTMNMELVDRIAAKPLHDKLDALTQDVALIKAKLQELLDR